MTKNRSVDIYGHPCRTITEQKGREIITFTEELHKEVARALNNYNPKKQVLFKDGDGFNIFPENLTQNIHDCVFTGNDEKKRPVICTDKGEVLVFESIKACADWFGLTADTISQGIYTGVNTKGLYIEYYFNTLPSVKFKKEFDLEFLGNRKIVSRREIKYMCDSKPFASLNDVSAYVDTMPCLLSRYFSKAKKEGKDYVFFKKKKIKKL